MGESPSKLDCFNSQVKENSPCGYCDGLNSESSPPSSCAGALTPAPQNVAVFGEKKEMITSNEALGLTLIQSDQCPYNKRKLAHRKRHQGRVRTEGRPCEDRRGRQWPPQAKEKGLWRTSPADTWVSDVQPPGLGGHKCLLFKPHSVVLCHGGRANKHRHKVKQWLFPGWSVSRS